MTFSLLSLLLTPLLFLTSISASYNPILPKSAFFPVTKDPTTLQYVTKLFMGETLSPIRLVLDLNGPFVWVDCGVSSGFPASQKPIKSCSLKCSMAKKSIRGCHGAAEQSSKTCTLQAENTISRIVTSAEVNEDKIAVELWDGVGVGSFAKSEKFLFSCAPNVLLKGLADGAKGMFGLGNSRISFQSQFSTKFGFFHRKFSLCLSPKNGAVFLGGRPSDFSSSMMYTPLISKKDGVQEGNYYINVGSIKISGKKLSLHQKGFLGAKISTVVPYTTMESKIYGTFVEAYVKAAKTMNLTLVPRVAPFEVCFGSTGDKSFGANVPSIDLVLQSEMVKWRVHGRNSMVDVGDDVMCLGFLDGGLSPRDAIVVGGYQLEDHLLEFNLGNSMLGFSSLVMGEKKCSDFEASASV